MIHKVRYKYQYDGKDLVDEKFYKDRLRRDEKLVILKDDSHLITLKK